ncbi:MAG: Phosphoesterase RecJ domain protein [Candidatus Magasanikbacteria bacterium GW2011_GWA2_46_17]|uniref:Phosphoesterase RecJ domain protein n=1 Tax=Candidatus Magasanikbacteria bacterium GW2011_GWA2_46_17 TaxID=1619042 RepID=A0A0G1RB97_9BACT|nr:MAG: Phosphoesterase RecJ domain protein [Candidatus Magasanikbacteria bacterium GW2011_GWA2_46_17]
MPCSMTLTAIQQLRQLIEAGKYILVAFNPAPSIDAIGGALAWKLFLEKQNKQVDVVADGFQISKSASFLPGVQSIKSEITHLQKFMIKVDVSRTKIDTLSYDVKDNVLSIYLTPKQGTIGKNDLRTAQSAFKYDLIITVGAHDLESLGPIFFNNTDLFYRLPVINFDHHSGNERFGQINLVEITAAATCEIIARTMEQLGETYITEQIATSLLAGMISQTKSFKTSTVTPHTLALAGRLMNLGADRDKIVQQLYRTKTLTVLKLWGEALSHLQSDPHFGIVWTTLTHEDFARTGAKENDLHGLIDELIASAPEAKIILLLHEHTGHNQGLIHGVLITEKQYDAMELLQPFHPEGSRRNASIKIENKTLREAENEILAQIKKIIQSTAHL